MAGFGKPAVDGPRSFDVDRRGRAIVSRVDHSSDRTGKRRALTNQKQAYLWGLTTVLLWSASASAFKLTLRYLDFIQLLFYSALVSVLVLGLILVLQGKLGRVAALSGGQYLRSLGLGLLNPLAYYLMVFKAYDLLPAQEAQPLNYTWAIVLSLLSVPLLKHKLTLQDLLATAVAYSGVVVISTHGRPWGMRFSDPLGVFLALACTVVWALYWIYSAKGELDPVVSLFLNFLFGLPFIALACFLFSDFGVREPRAILGAVWVGLFEFGIAFVCWLKALKLAESAVKVGNLIFIAPFLSLVLIRLTVGERIMGSTVVGLVMILAGLAIQQVKAGKGRPG